MCVLGRGGGGGGGVCSLANYNVAHGETQLNRVSDFRVFVCSLFPKQSCFTFIHVVLLMVESQMTNTDYKLL